MSNAPFQSKTYSPADLRAASVAPVAQELRRWALGMGWRGTKFAVNGVLKWRCRIRRHKLWEYARGVAFLERERGGEASFRVLDFGGAATPPVFFLAARGCRLLCLDIDSQLSEWTNQLAQRRGWPLRASTHDLVALPAPEDWGPFDAVMSFSVLEHIAKPEQPRVLKRLAALLRPGGVFALTFDFGEDAPVEGAVRSVAEVEQLVTATGLGYFQSGAFFDTGERFELDKRFPGRRYTFGSVFLRKEEH
jgi:SAM-dependent methyltransferase